QAEDGIRDATVTGVQTCALPISHIRHHPSGSGVLAPGPGPRPLEHEIYQPLRLGPRDERPRIESQVERPKADAADGVGERDPARSEERRVGEEGRWGGSQERWRR